MEEGRNLLDEEADRLAAENREAFQMLKLTRNLKINVLLTRGWINVIIAGNRVVFCWSFYYL
jgi:hypothetical protein